MNAELPLLADPRALEIWCPPPFGHHRLEIQNYMQLGPGSLFFVLCGDAEGAEQASTSFFKKCELGMIELGG